MLASLGLRVGFRSHRQPRRGRAHGWLGAAGGAALPCCAGLQLLPCVRLSTSTHPMCVAPSLMGVHSFLGRRVSAQHVALAPVHLVPPRSSVPVRHLNYGQRVIEAPKRGHVRPGCRFCRSTHPFAPAQRKQKKPSLLALFRDSLRLTLFLSPCLPSRVFRLHSPRPPRWLLFERCLARGPTQVSETAKSLAVQARGVWSVEAVPQPRCPCSRPMATPEPPSYLSAVNLVVFLSPELVLLTWACLAVAISSRSPTARHRSRNSACSSSSCAPPGPLGLPRRRRRRRANPTCGERGRGPRRGRPTLNRAPNQGEARRIGRGGGARLAVGAAVTQARPGAARSPSNTGVQTAVLRRRKTLVPYKPK